MNCPNVLYTSDNVLDKESTQKDQFYNIFYEEIKLYLANPYFEIDDILQIINFDFSEENFELEEKEFNNGKSIEKIYLINNVGKNKLQNARLIIEFYAILKERSNKKYSLKSGLKNALIRFNNFFAEEGVKIISDFDNLDDLEAEINTLIKSEEIKKDSIKKELQKNLELILEAKKSLVKYDARTKVINDYLKFFNFSKFDENEVLSNFGSELKQAKEKNLQKLLPKNIREEFNNPSFLTNEKNELTNNSEISLSNGKINNLKVYFSAAIFLLISGVGYYRFTLNDKNDIPQINKAEKSQAIKEYSDLEIENIFRETIDELYENNEYKTNNINELLDLITLSFGFTFKSKDLYNCKLKMSKGSEVSIIFTFTYKGKSFNYEKQINNKYFDFNEQLRKNREEFLNNYLNSFIINNDTILSVIFSLDKEIKNNSLFYKTESKVEYNLGEIIIKVKDHYGTLDYTYRLY